MPLAGYATITLPNTAPPHTGTGAWHDDVVLTDDATLTNNGQLTIGQKISPGTRASHFLHDINLNNFELTLSGTGDTLIQSNILGSGNITIDLDTANSKVTYHTLYDRPGGNPTTYTGTTHVKSGILELNTLSGKRDAIVGDLIIGGAGAVAEVTRKSNVANRQLIADTAHVLIREQGTFKLNRGNARNQSSQETIGALTLDGGTLMNATTSSKSTTLTVKNGLTLSSTSTIKLGQGGMNLKFSDSSHLSWGNGQLIIEGYYHSNQGSNRKSRVSFGNNATGLTSDQLGKIFFKNPNGSTGLWSSQINARGVLTPLVPIPEPGTLYAGAFSLLWCLRHFRKRKH
tara:strand:- start:72519 stop:73550 length:1032 start_codon:yes stop_codon:yes gene_type:complete